tara:strand:- start:1769 stop:2815 length:1047 start_codon:yes stop_codon:yes gene_type:complete
MSKYVDEADKEVANFTGKSSNLKIRKISARDSPRGQIDSPRGQRTATPRRMFGSPTINNNFAESVKGSLNKSFEKININKSPKSMDHLNENEIGIYIASVDFPDIGEYNTKYKQQMIDLWKFLVMKGKLGVFKSVAHGPYIYGRFWQKREADIQYSYFVKMILSGKLQSKDEFKTFMNADFFHIYKVGGYYSQSEKYDRENAYKGNGPLTNMPGFVPYYFSHSWIIKFITNDFRHTRKRVYMELVEKSIHERLFAEGYMANNPNDPDKRLQKSELVFNIHSCDLQQLIQNILTDLKDNKTILSFTTTDNKASEISIQITEVTPKTNCADVSNIEKSNTLKTFVSTLKF